MTQIASLPAPAATGESLIDGAYLNAIADLADSRGPAHFTPGGGILFDSPITREERLSLPAPTNSAPRFVDLPQDRFAATLARRPKFRDFVANYTVPHLRAGYRLVVIPIVGGLTADQLRAIASAADAFGHGTLRLTAGVSIRLPNVPTALLRPLLRALDAADLVTAQDLKRAA